MIDARDKNERTPHGRREGEGWMAKIPPDYRLLTFVILNCLILNLIIHFTTDLLLWHGVLDRKALDSNFHTGFRFFRRLQGSDSWHPMFAATEFFRAHRDVPLYQSIFFQRHIKFQYPLTSILPIYAWMQNASLTFSQFLAFTRMVCWLAVWLTVAMAVLLAAEFLPPQATRPRARMANLTA